MQVGDKVTFTPDAWANVKNVEDSKMHVPVQVTGTVVWIHPDRRFYVAAAQVHGHKIAETLYFSKR